jgi:hypothetical protein
VKRLLSLVALVAFCTLIMARPVAANIFGGGGGGVGAGLVCLLSGGSNCTMTGSIIFNNSGNTALTTTGNNDLVLDAAGSGRTMLADTVTPGTGNNFVLQFLGAGGVGFDMKNAAGNDVLQIIAGANPQVFLNDKSGSNKFLFFDPLSGLIKGNQTTGAGLRVYSSVSGSSTYGVTLGTESNTTAQFDGGFAHNVNATEVYDFDVAGTGDARARSSYRTDAKTLDTCAAATEGYIERDTLAGGTSTTHATRVCLCQSDGAASPAFKWRNMASGTLGTTTTCAD